MQAEIRNDRLYLIPATIAEYQAAWLWSELNMPVQVFIERPVQAIQAYKLSLTDNTI